MKLTANIFAACVLVSVLTWTGRAQVPGWNMIRGTVVDQEGVAVDGAEVCAWGTGPISGRLPCSQSTQDGGFSIPVSRADTYTVSAKHFKKGYPEGSWTFYAKLWRHVATVIVQENSTPDPVKVVVGPKAGRLVLKILDGDTDNAIDKGSVTLCRVNEPKSCAGINTSFPKGRYEVLTPEVPFTIKFQTWHGEWVDRKAVDNATGLPVEVLQLDLGSRKEITVRLK